MSDTIRRSRPLALIRRNRWGRRQGGRDSGVVGQAPQTIRSIEYGGTRWVDVRNPNGEQIEELGRDFNLHPLTIDDLKSRIQRPKIDIYDDYLFVVLKFPIHDKERRMNEAAEIDFVVGRDLFMTFHDGRLRPLVTMIDSIFESDEISIELLRATPGHLLYEVVDRLVDYLVPIVPRLEERVAEIEQMIFDERSLHTVQEISIVQRDLISLRRILRPQLTLLHRLEVTTFPFLDEELDEYWGDVSDHLGRTLDSLEELSEILTALSDTHDKLTSQRMNDIIKTLTVFSVIVLPLTAIGGFFGMNVPFPYQDEWYSTVIILALMIVLSLGMLQYFRMKHWL
ncbi:MAG TPA: magnesium transporter CorA family protein [Thermomicrobiales bacterium]|nr:magnesium transporter CorA family protein [Thermomicrobiales bacterium]